MLNPLQDKEFLKQLDTVKNKTTYIKITSLDQENKPLEVIEGKATGGSINVDGASAVRRSCSLTLITLQNENDITDVYWSLKHKFELEVGIENNINPNYSSVIWFKQGCYVINSFSKNNNTNNLTISISGQDKMALLNGSLGGSFTHEIDFGTEEEVDVYGDIITRKVPIYKIIKNALQVYAQESIENIVINDLDEYGWELWEYRGEKPLYYLYKTTDNDISNEVVSYINNPDTIVYVHQNDEIYESKISDIPQYYSLNTLDKDYNLTATQVAMRESDWRWEKEGENTITYSFTNQLGKDIQDLYLNFNKNTNNSDNDLGYTFELSITNEYKNKYNFIFRADSLGDEDIKNNYTIDELKEWAGEKINVVFHKYDQYIDFNNDGEFNDKDVKLLSEYVAGYRGEEYEKVVVYGDINNDGEINLEDTRELIIKTLVTYDEVNKTLHVPYGARFWLVAQPTDKAIQGDILELTTTLPLDENRSKVFTMFNKDHKEETFYITKVDYGETAGYHKIDLVYNDDLILKAGENITTLLDKIKNMLGNFEYFYDINGKFIFQKKKNYLQELFSPINGNIVNPTMTISPYEYKFDNLENVVSFSNSSQINNVKNDFTIWGQKRNGVNQIPFHIRYAIHEKPVYYKTQEFYEKRDLIYLDVSNYSDGKAFVQEGKNYKLVNSGEVYSSEAVQNISFSKRSVSETKLDDGSFNYIISYTRNETKALPISIQKYQIKADFSLRFLYNENYNKFKEGEKRPYLENIKEIGLYGKTVNSDKYTKITNLNFTLDLENTKKIEKDDKLIEVIHSVSYFEPQQVYSDFKICVKITNYTDKIGTDNQFWGGITIDFYRALTKYSLLETTEQPPYISNSSQLYYYKNNAYHCIKEGDIYYRKKDGIEEYEELSSPLPEEPSSPLPEEPSSHLPEEPGEYYINHVSKEYSVNEYDWRELIYQMAQDYYRHNTKPDFLYNVQVSNTINGKCYYPKGITGYEQYYSDIQGFWRLLYNPDSDTIDYGSATYEFYTDKDKVNDKYWNKAIHNDPNSLPFWFEFLDLKGTNMEKYSINNIGQRTKVINDTTINSIYYKEIPEVQFIIQGKEKLVNDFNTSFWPVQITEDEEAMFSRSAQGISAIEKINELIFQHSYCTESLSLNCVPIWYLNPNTRIYIEDQGDFILDKISYNLNYNSTMSLTCTKIAKQVF